jgi:phosphatidylethanolamine-binding protein (PEBP) family uncharacterized protein
MKIWSDSFVEGGPIPPRCAFAEIDPGSHIKLSSNRSPHIAWDEVPTGAESLVLLCHDLDVPTDGANVNREGRTVPDALARTDFYHWSLVDIPVVLNSFAEGLFSDMVTPGGKSGPLVPFTIKNGTEHQLRHGVNDYTGWFASDPDMAGEYRPGTTNGCTPTSSRCTRSTSRACPWRGGSRARKRAWPSPATSWTKPGSSACIR